MDAVATGAQKRSNEKYAHVLEIQKRAYERIKAEILYRVKCLDEEMLSSENPPEPPSKLNPAAKYNKLKKNPPKLLKIRLFMYSLHDLFDWIERVGANAQLAFGVILMLGGLSAAFLSVLADNEGGFASFFELFLQLFLKLLIFLGGIFIILRGKSHASCFMGLMLLGEACCYSLAAIFNEEVFVTGGNVLLWASSFYWALSFVYFILFVLFFESAFEYKQEIDSLKEEVAKYNSDFKEWQNQLTSWTEGRPETKLANAKKMNIKELLVLQLTILETQLNLIEVELGDVCLQANVYKNHIELTSDERLKIDVIVNSLGDAILRGADCGASIL